MASAPREAPSTHAASSFQQSFSHFPLLIPERGQNQQMRSTSTSRNFKHEYTNRFARNRFPPSVLPTFAKRHRKRFFDLSVLRLCPITGSETPCASPRTENGEDKCRSPTLSLRFRMPNLSLPDRPPPFLMRVTAHIIHPVPAVMKRC
ncbi:hypothetical protein TRVL_07019 [Trypanosoma vivax]|nr:hypothetical protein TRVL_07019 [Trypanosoma vivax]